MKKFPVYMASPEGGCKRSLTMQQIEILFVLSASINITKHKKYFDIQFSYFSYGGFRKSVVQVKKIPNGYLQKFTIETE